MSINGMKLEDNFYSAGKVYWDGIEPTLDGMLGGFTMVTSPDINASTRFLTKWFPQLDAKKSAVKESTAEDTESTPSPAETTRALDCGAGIGRVSKHLLLKFFDTVDLLEQSDKFLAQTKTYMSAEEYARVGNQYNVGLQDFAPEADVLYDCIWCQWVVGHLTDEDFVRFLVRCKSALKQPNGVIVVKDNTTSSDECDADTNDSS
ncbi:unnamed protein product, partial [Medioppia subpectinata]